MSITDFDESYDKLGGWLILPAILHPLIGAGQSVYGAFETLSLFSDRLPAPNQVFIMSIGLGLVALAIGWAAALYYACTINPIFPKFYIWLTIISILSGIVAVVTSHILFRVEANPSDYKDVVQSIMVGCIWVPYMLVSKRVKATFYGIPFPKKPPRSAFAPLDLKGDARNAPREIDAETLRYRKKGNRLGIFVTLFSLVLLIAGVLGSSNYPQPAWSGLILAAGAFGTLFGYMFSRLWYWFKSA